MSEQLTVENPQTDQIQEPQAHELTIPGYVPTTQELIFAEQSKAAFSATEINPEDPTRAYLSGPLGEAPANASAIIDQANGAPRDITVRR